MTDQDPKHVFISYVRENQKEVDRLCQDLEAQGVKVWLDRQSIKPGARWKDAIREAIRKGDFFIACFSNEYASKTKTYMNEELTLAIEELRQYHSAREWFIPVLLAECDVPARSIGAGATLLDINWVPLYEDWNAGIQRILSVIKPISPKIQNFITALNSENKVIRREAFRELCKINNASIVPALIIALNDEDKNVRHEAVYTLGSIGAEAKAAVPLLIKALNDPYEKVRQTAAHVLRKISPESKEIVAALIEALKDENWSVRHEAINSLYQISDPSISIMPTLLQALKDKDKYVRRETVKELEVIGSKVKDAVRALNEALNDEDLSVRWRAKDALANINTPEAQKALEEYRKKHG